MPTQTFTIPLRDYQTGERTVERNLQQWVRVIRLRLARCTTATPTIWPDSATYVNIELEATFDGGATWVPAGGWGAYGGIFIRRDGTEAQYSEASFVYPGGGTVRAHLTIQNGPCRTSGQISVSDA